MRGSRGGRGGRGGIDGQDLAFLINTLEIAHFAEASALLYDVIRISKLFSHGYRQWVEV